MLVLVINCGSSSIKYQLFNMTDESVMAKGLLEKIGEGDSALHHERNGQKISIEKPVAEHKAGLDLILKTLVDDDIGVIKDINEIKAVGHRVVHGGEEFVESCLITDEAIDAIERFSDLAPLHNPPNLMGIRAAMEEMPGVPQVAVFDTSFHQTMPPAAYTYALPWELYEKHRVRRYGFHGTSHRYVTIKAAEMLGKPLSETNVITCHLGNGCSITAVENGRSVDTTMGLTPLEGVVMGTRCGDIDPAITFYIADADGLSLDEINTLYNKKSGLLGLSGVSNDMREVKAAADGGNERAILALKVYAYRIRKYIGAYKAVLGRVDAVVFTGGVGENATFMREMTAVNLDSLGIVLDKDKNRALAGKAGVVSAAGSPTQILVIPTNEEKMIAEDTMAIAESQAK
ncbi:MAG: acetate kinase [Planctomycetes bacterium]|nr:acetate kinase [Planctomycetota bacterium]